MPLQFNRPLVLTARTGPTFKDRSDAHGQSGSLVRVEGSRGAQIDANEAIESLGAGIAIDNSKLGTSRFRLLASTA